MPIISNGQWVPEDHPLYLAEQQKLAQPTSTTIAPTQQYQSTGMAPETQAQAPVSGGVQLAGAVPMTQTSYQSPTTTYSGSGETQVQPPGTTFSGNGGTPAPAPTTPTNWNGGGDMTPAQAGAAGLGWVPKDHPLYGTPGYVGSTPAAPAPGATPPGGVGTTYTPPNLAPGTPGANPLDTQNSNAQTYSQTPGAPPANATTNQGTQDVVRNEYLQSIQKGTAVDRNSADFRQQADAFAGAQERARRNAQDDNLQSSFASGTRGSGAENVERRMMDESAARNTGQFEAQLVGQELSNRRSEIQNALSSLGGMIDNDQKLALQRELAGLDAAIKREQISSSERMGVSDINLRDKLGTGGLNIDLLRAMMQNQQFGDEMGFTASNAAVQNWLRANGM